MAHNNMVAWTAPPDANASTVYNVYRSKTKGAEVPGTPINPAPVAGTSFVDSNVAVGDTWYYVVEAVTNGVSSGPSIEASATITPFAPTNVTATQSTS